MEIDISSIEKLRLARAFLVYENRDREAVFVSSHLIKVFEDETGKHHAQIQPGSPLSKNALFNALNELANQQHEKDSLLPTTVLCRDIQSFDLVETAIQGSGFFPVTRSGFTRKGNFPSWLVVPDP